MQWRPGVTRVPVQDSKGNNFFVWTGDRERYRPMTRVGRRKLLYGIGDRRHRTKPDQPFIDLEEQRHLLILDREARDPETGEAAWLIVPGAAAKAIQKKERQAKSHSPGQNETSKSKLANE